MADPFTIDPSYASRLFQIEGGGSPYAPATGSNRGMGQFSPDLERKYGITDANRTDPGAQATAVGREVQDHAPVLSRALGRAPTPGELYLAHQQGIGGAVAHLTNPDQPAWQSMASTAEGRAKGQDWARRAIWGNIPDRPQDSPNFNKTMFPGGVGSVTSGAFSQGWINKFQGGMTGGPQMAAGGASGPGASPAAQGSSPVPAASAGAGPGMLSGTDLAPAQSSGPNLGLLAQQMAQANQPPAPPPMQPIAMPMPPGRLRARLRMAALGSGF
jgi:hypothetical protein